MKRVIYLLILAMMVCPGCASIICSSEKTVNIDSSPTGADFDIKDPSGKVIIKDVTPTNVTLKRGRGWFQSGDYTISFEKEGYQNLTTNVNQGLETGWYIGGNIVFGGLIGLVIVDPLTGAMWNIKDVAVRLNPHTVIHTSEGQKKIIGYHGSVNPSNGKVETTPIYEKKE